MRNRIVITDGGRLTVSEEFKVKLHAFDPKLTVSWNDLKQRFVIEMCEQHLSGLTEHNHLCRRSYVWLVQDEEDGSMLPLGEHVLDKLRSIDNERKGYGPEDAAAFIRDFKANDKSIRDKISRDQSDAVKHASRMNRIQLRKALHLIQQHSLEVNQ